MPAVVTEMAAASAHAELKHSFFARRREFLIAGPDGTDTPKTIGRRSPMIEPAL